MPAYPRAELEEMVERWLEANRAGEAKQDWRHMADLYTEDAVLMAQESPPAVGAAVVRQAYVGVFQAIALDIAFHVAEVVELTPEWAFACTTSTGKMRINATGATLPEANQELFIFKKVGGTWKIARYSFFVINPLARP